MWTSQRRVIDNRNNPWEHKDMWVKHKASVDRDEKQKYRSKKEPVTGPHRFLGYYFERKGKTMKGFNPFCPIIPDV